MMLNCEPETPEEYAPAIAARAGGIRKLRDENFVSLQARLARSRSKDAYVKSAFYYALTGRGDIWVIDHDDGGIICARHPNIKGSLLVFFPFADTAYKLGLQIATLAESPGFLAQFSDVCLAKIEAEQWNALLSGAETGDDFVLRNMRLQRIEEETLDWRFPSYDVSISALADRKGAGLAGFRNKLQKFDAGNLQVIPLAEIRSDIALSIVDIAESWVSSRLIRLGIGEPGDDCLVEIIAPYIRLAEFSVKNRCNLDGLFLLRRREYLGFALWERPRSVEDPVPVVAALHRSYEKGLAERMQFQIARMLNESGYQRMCIGGSETAGLDRFKRKLGPVAEHKLCTIRLSLPKSFSNSQG